MLAGDWHKSSYSHANGNCLEAAYQGVVQVRDTKQEHTPDDERIVLRFTPRAWNVFLAGVRRPAS